MILSNVCFWLIKFAPWSLIPCHGIRNIAGLCCLTSSVMGHVSIHGRTMKKRYSHRNAIKSFSRLHCFHIYNVSFAELGVSKEFTFCAKYTCRGHDSETTLIKWIHPSKSWIDWTSDRLNLSSNDTSRKCQDNYNITLDTEIACSCTSNVIMLRISKVKYVTRLEKCPTLFLKWKLL